MKKLFILIMISMFSFLLFAADTAEREADEKNVFDYMDANGIEYKINDGEGLKELPKGATVLSIESVQEFIASAMNTKTVTMEAYAYADWNNSPEERLEFAGGVDSTSYTGYQFKWERYIPFLYTYSNFTKSRMCPGGSGNATVDYCTETDSSVTTQYGDYSESIACSACDNNFIFRIRYGANLYTTSYIRVWNGWFWTWVPVTIYAGWQYSITDGTPQPYAPSYDLCDAPVLLTTLCN